MRSFFSLIVLVLLLPMTSCQSREGLLTKVWFYMYEAKETAVESRKDPVLLPTNYISLQSKGKYTADLEGFEHGEWSLEDKVLILRPATGKPRRVLIKKLSDKEMIADIDATNRDQSASAFEGSSNPFSKEENNPFSLANNKWRLKAAQKETPAQITERLLNHFKYWEQYFKWGLESDKRSLEVRELPSPLKMYGNGFALMPIDRWPARWTDTFFDDADRQVAFEKIRWVLRNKSVKWPETEHRFKQFVSAFQQMQTNIVLAP